RTTTPWILTYFPTRRSSDLVVATAIECTAGHTTEVTYARQRDSDQAVQKFVHTATTQRDHAADRVVFPNLEAGNSLLGLGDDRRSKEHTSELQSRENIV